MRQHFQTIMLTMLNNQMTALCQEMSRQFGSLHLTHSLLPTNHTHVEQFILPTKITGLDMEIKDSAETQ
eukprot:4071160-Ditylum_brightwellii.AAC.1